MTILAAEVSLADPLHPGVVHTLVLDRGGAGVLQAVMTGPDHLPSIEDIPWGLLLHSDHTTTSYTCQVITMLLLSPGSLEINRSYVTYSTGRGGGRGGRENTCLAEGKGEQ